MDCFPPWGGVGGGTAIDRPSVAKISSGRRIPEKVQKKAWEPVFSPLPKFSPLRRVSASGNGSWAQVDSSASPAGAAAYPAPAPREPTRPHASRGVTGPSSAQGFLCFALVFCVLTQMAFWRFHNPAQVRARPACPSPRGGSQEVMRKSVSCFHPLTSQ